MQNEQQFEQLMLQYNQLKNGSEDIKQMILKENYDDAITMIKSREEIFLSCKCIRKFLELTPVQEEELSSILDEIKVLEKENMNLIKQGMIQVQAEIKKSNQTEKIQHAYDFDEGHKGNIVNYSE